MVLSSASTATWPSVCLATARTSCWGRSANVTTERGCLDWGPSNPHRYCCFVIYRTSLSWCPVSMSGCRTRTERPDPSLILMQRPLKVLQHPGYQENMVSVGICKVLIFTCHAVLFVCTVHHLIVSYFNFRPILTSGRRHGHGAPSSSGKDFSRERQDLHWHQHDAG